MCRRAARFGCSRWIEAALPTTTRLAGRCAPGSRGTQLVASPSVTAQIDHGDGIMLIQMGSAPLTRWPIC